MKFETSDETRRFCNVVITHGSETLTWDTSLYSKATTLTVAEVFSEMNAYLERLSFQRQAAIFAVYKQIHEVITDVYTKDNPVGPLIALTKELYNQVPMSELEAWVLHKDANIILPASLLTEYGDQPAARTYLKDDYQQLVVLALALRLMLPIWGEYIREYGDEAGSTHKEKAALKILARSWVLTSKPAERLQEYLMNLIPRELKLAPVFNGLGSEELPEWILGLVCTRRLVVSPLSSPDEKTNLISSVYNYTHTNTFNSMERKFRQLIVEKHRASPHGEDNTSLLENYKVKQPLSDGDVMMLSVYTEFTTDGVSGSRKLAMAESIDPSIPMAFVEACVAEIPKIIRMNILTHHYTLVQYVVSSVIPAAGVESLNRSSFLRALAVSQAVLWHWGFYDLAALITASPNNNSSGNMFGIETRPRIPKELVERLVELYPYYQAVGNRNDVASMEKQRRQNNPAIKAIDILSKEINNKEWNLYAPLELVRLSSATRGTRRMFAPPDLKTQLANLCIKISTRNEWFGQQ